MSTAPPTGTTVAAAAAPSMQTAIPIAAAPASDPKNLNTMPMAAQALSAAAKACFAWFVMIVLSLVMFIIAIVDLKSRNCDANGLFYVDTSGATGGPSPTLYPCNMGNLYAASLAGAPIMIIVAVVALRSMQFSFSGCTVGQDLNAYVKNVLAITTYVGCLFGSALFVWGVIYVLAFNVWMLVAPAMFVPCCLAMAIGIVQWTGCCCCTNELNKLLTNPPMMVTYATPVQGQFIQPQIVQGYAQPYGQPQPYMQQQQQQVAYYQQSGVQSYAQPQAYAQPQQGQYMQAQPQFVQPQFAPSAPTS